jgi:hypothetical protein
VCKALPKRKLPFPTVLMHIYVLLVLDFFREMYKYPNFNAIYIV